MTEPDLARPAAPRRPRTSASAISLPDRHAGDRQLPRAGRSWPAAARRPCSRRRSRQAARRGADAALEARSRSCRCRRRRCPRPPDRRRAASSALEDVLGLHVHAVDVVEVAVPRLGARPGSAHQSPTGRADRPCSRHAMAASRTTPTLCVFVMSTGPSRKPDSSTHVVPVISPLPFSENQPANDGLLQRVAPARQDRRDARAHRPLADDERAVARDDRRVADRHARHVGDRVERARRPVERHAEVARARPRLAVRRRPPPPTASPGELRSETIRQRAAMVSDANCRCREAKTVSDSNDAQRPPFSMLRTCTCAARWSGRRPGRA